MVSQRAARPGVTRHHPRPYISTGRLQFSPLPMDTFVQSVGDYIFFHLGNCVKHKYIADYFSLAKRHGNKLGENIRSKICLLTWFYKRIIILSCKPTIIIVLSCSHCFLIIVYYWSLIYYEFRMSLQPNIRKTANKEC